MKTQTIRLIDVFVLGPFMIWASTKLKNENAQAAMLAAGVFTITYNWENWKTHELNVTDSDGNNRGRI